MGVLIIDEVAKKKIEMLLDHAKKNPISLTQLKEGFVAGEHSEFEIILTDYKCVLTVEEQLVGDLYHLSISVNKIGKLPNPQIVEEILHLFGIQGTIHDQVNVWLEPKENPIAINVLSWKGD